MQQFASCVLDRSPNGVAKAFAQSSVSLQNAALAKIADSECLLGGQIRFQAIVMRGALFAEMYRRREVGANLMPVVAAYDLSDAAKSAEPASIYWWLLDFADCVAQRDREAAGNFVTSIAVSKAETTALAALTPSLGPCVTADQKLTLNRATIKGALAEALYRGARSPNAAVGKN